MIFVGNGSLLRHALIFCEGHGIPVDLVCLPNADGLYEFCSRKGIKTLITKTPNTHLLQSLDLSSDGVVMSIDNKTILSDQILSSGHRYFNIHNGLTQKYRGIAEVCVFAAVLRGEREYGATLHKLLPNQEVDAGPIIKQSTFIIQQGMTFQQVFRLSLENCKNIFESTVHNLFDSSKELSYEVELGEILTYKDVSSLLKFSDHEAYLRAVSLGSYAGLLPKLSELLA